MASRCWCWTINNPDGTPEDLLQTLQQCPLIRFATFQLEVGSNGTPHMQGYTELSSPRRLSFMSALLPRAHLETRRGSREQAIAYCNKEATRQAGPWTMGTTESRQGQRTDLDRGVELVNDGGLKRLRAEDPSLFVRYSRGFEALARSRILDPRPTPPEVILLYGPTGCGKTRWFYDNTDLDTAYRMPLTTGFWFDGYDEHDDVLIDDFAGAASHITLAHLLQLLDRYPIRVPVKGSFIDWVPKRIMVTTNIHPRLWYDYSKREEHYNALARRFTRLLLWRRDSTLVERSAGDPDRQRFFDDFRTPDTGEPRYDGLNAYYTVTPFDQYGYY